MSDYTICRHISTKNIATYTTPCGGKYYWFEITFITCINHELNINTDEIMDIIGINLGLNINTDTIYIGFRLEIIMDMVYIDPGLEINNHMAIYMKNLNN